MTFLCIDKNTLVLVTNKNKGTYTPKSTIIDTLAKSKAAVTDVIPNNQALPSVLDLLIKSAIGLIMCKKLLESY